MKDILIKGKRLKKELYIFAGCFIVAIGMNVYSIIKFKTDWSELIGQMHIVIIIALSIWILVAIFRLMFWGFLHLFRN